MHLFLQDICQLRNRCEIAVYGVAIVCIGRLSVTAWCKSGLCLHCVVAAILLESRYLFCGHFMFTVDSSHAGANPTRCKICGLTSVADAQLAVAAGADAIGLVFYPKSPRYVAPQQAAAIARAVGPFVTVVGLFVDASADEIRAVLAEVPLHVLQFHGNESPDFCASVGRPFIKAIRMGEGVDVLAQDTAFANAGALGLLLDSYSPAAPGGTGETFGWERIPIGRRLPLILAGGLSGDNVAAAIAQVKPYAVDVSSGVEIAPGRKDSAKITAFIRAARGA